MANWDNIIGAGRMKRVKVKTISLLLQLKVLSHSRFTLTERITQ